MLFIYLKILLIQIFLKILQIEGSGSYREKNNDPKVRKQEKVSHLKKVVSFVKIAHLSLHLFVFAFSILYLNSSLKKNSLLFDSKRYIFIILGI